jgi:hypothetical protein
MAADPDASDTDDVTDEAARKAANVKALLNNRCTDYSWGSDCHPLTLIV